MNSLTKINILKAIVVVLFLSFLITGCQNPVNSSSPDPSSSEKTITAFSFTNPAATGTVNETDHTISITVPYGTNVTDLTPTITHTGKSISPESGISQDFTKPVTYTVTAEDGKTQNYIVTVTVTKNTVKEVTAFSFTNPAATGTVNETDHTISITVPYGTDVTDLTPTITHTGKSISPESGISQDFTNPVTYTVTAEDDSTLEYLVTVTVEKEVTFSFANLQASVTVNETDHTISITVPYGTDVTDLTPTITLAPGSSISPAPGVSQDFTEPVTYTITREDGTTQEYVVTTLISVTRAQLDTMIDNDEDIRYVDTSDITDMNKLFYWKKDFNQDISNWDVSNVINMSEMFYGAYAFNQDISNWDVSSVTDMSYMFHAARAFNQDISKWDVSNVSYMNYMFDDAYAFNKDIPNWNVSNVTDMSYMFDNANAFNRDISNWDVSSVTDMNHMFNGADAFNRDISNWDVGNVTNMSRMFDSAEAFNRDISIWDVSSVTDMSYMFNESDVFNQDISSWDVSSVTDMTYMFSNAAAFNRSLSKWDVRNVTSMRGMFYQASHFNGDISGWDVSSVTNMRGLFDEATAFNQNISSWNVSSVTDMSLMFDDATAFNQNISSWDVSSVTDMNLMFSDADAFNQDISSWDVSSVTDMSYMFNESDAFNQDISSWDVSSVTDMTDMFYNAKAFNQDISGWSDDVAETIDHGGFSSRDCPLYKSYHPYNSWADDDDTN